MSINNDKRAMRMFCDRVSEIENYEQAISDNDRWELHHRLETHNENGVEREIPITQKELKEQGLFYHRPPHEFIFMRKSDHIALHSRIRQKTYTMTDEHRQHMIESRKGLIWFTDGVHETKAWACPEGYHEGRLPRTDDLKQKLHDHFKKAKWWTNGTVDKFSEECPEGFHRGRSANRKKVC